MREILFRGKREDNGGWAYGSLLCYKGYSIFDEIWENFLTVQAKTIGQYTGLKDKNGKRIFEGDICRNVKTGEIVSVKWHGTMAGYVWSKRTANNKNLYDFGELFRAFDRYEIIGNIHDNPEFLEVDNG